SHDPKLLAKVYHNPNEAHARKLAAMLANPPDKSAHGHASIAWPVELLRLEDGKQNVVGFLMPRVTGMHHIIDMYTPGTRRKLCPMFNYVYLHRAARNLAAAFHAIHTRGYVVGDVKESNILVASNALVALVDTDSFQVRASGVTYRCPVGTGEFTPPELQGKKFSTIDRTPIHDLFGLGVIIFQLLMEGVHPFAGIYTGSGDPPPVEARIKAGHFAYSGRSPYRPMKMAPPLSIVHPKVQALFMRCFDMGHKDPNARPSALTWQNALEEAEKDL
ncbi:MAG TPA: hypothetical protein VGB77_20715, partial [Abditibacteriaceae bacterium]